MKSARAQILRCGRKIGGPRAGCLLQMVEVLDDRKAEADQRHRGTLPRHLRAFDTEARPQPAEVAVRGCPHFEPFHA